jgi:hypothetical protein
MFSRPEGVYADVLCILVGLGSGKRRDGSLHELDALEEPHDLEDAEGLDHAQDPLVAAHVDGAVPLLALLPGHVVEAGKG